MRFTTLPAVLVLAAAASAQSFYLPSNTPSTGVNNVFPFGTSDMRYQALIPASDLNSTPALITGFGLAAGSTGVRSFQRVTMKMAHLSAPSLSTTFDANLAAGAVTTMDVPDWHWHLTANVWNDVDLQQPFVYNGVDNLVVEFLVIGSSGVNGAMRRDNTHQRVYQGSYTGQPTGTDGGLTAFKMRVFTGDASAWTFGRGCQGSNNATPALSFTGNGELGTILTVEQNNALATSPVLLHLGLTSAQPVFPLDLGPLGAQGCWVYNDILAGFGAVTSATGFAAIRFPIPLDRNLMGLRAYFQWANPDAAANRLGWTTSNYGRVLLGT